VSDEYGRARNPDDLTEEAYARAADSAGPEHTDVHRIGSRLVELLQDVAVLLLNVTLLGMGFVFLYRVWREIFALGNLQEGLSNIIPRGDHHRALPALCPLPEVPPRESEPPGRGGGFGDHPEDDPGGGG
jgi:hypothetical protein